MALTYFWLLTSTPWPFFFPQAKQAIIPALLGMTEGMRYSFRACLLIKYLGSNVAQAAQLQAVTELPTLSSKSSATSPRGAHTKCISGHLALALRAATQPGTSPGPIQAFNYHPGSADLSQGIYTFILIQL